MSDNRKGGYQIVEIGTGIVGMYDKLKSAYESNKPILVKKNGNVTFGNVTKDGNYYVANYIIDDTLYQDTISALDAITDSSIDIGGNAGDIEALEADVNTLFNKTIKKAVYTLEPNDTLYLQPGTDNPLPYMYMVTMYGSSGISNRAYIGCGYGATTARHVLTKLCGEDTTSITVTVSNDNYGLSIVNGGTATLNITVTSFLAG